MNLMQYFLNIFIRIDIFFPVSESNIFRMIIFWFLFIFIPIYSIWFDDRPETYIKKLILKTMYKWIHKFYLLASKIFLNRMSNKCFYEYYLFKISNYMIELYWNNLIYLVVQHESFCLKKLKIFIRRYYYILLNVIFVLLS